MIAYLPNLITPAHEGVRSQPERAGRVRGAVGLAPLSTPSMTQFSLILCLRKFPNRVASLIK